MRAGAGAARQPAIAMGGGASKKSAKAKETGKKADGKKADDLEDGQLFSSTRRRKLLIGQMEPRPFESVKPAEQYSAMPEARGRLLHVMLRSTFN